jgi:predicted nucleotidyltransferase
VVIVTCGSYARREASTHSDIDFFVITQERDLPSDQSTESKTLPWVELARNAINKIVPVEPAEEGAFATIESQEALLRNIGGENDSNYKITRRMLILLEGEWLFNQAGLKHVRRQILERYIGEGMTDHQLALFLLNDIIRYYRTMCVDYEFKTGEGDRPKPWGIRNIKLVFSRKLLYASGLFSVATTADRALEQKIGVLEELFDKPVIDRMIQICGPSKMEPVLASYDHFLGRLESYEVRQRLTDLGRHGRSDPLFRELKNEGHHFTRELLKLFEATFDATHPIRRAVVL